MKKLLAILLLLCLATPFALAEIDFSQDLTADEQATVDSILAPVMSIYNAIKYAMSVVAVLALMFAGVTFVTAGGETAKKDRAKNMIAGVVIGLVIIWVAPLVVQFVFS